MARPKKQVIMKEPIRLREMALKDGRKSLYLDIYDKGKRSYKFLKMYLVPENSHEDAVNNINTLAEANAIKNEMIYDLTNRKAGITDRSYKAKMLLTDWMDIYRQDMERRKGKSMEMVKHTIDRLKDYKSEATLQEVDRSFIQGFLEHLLSMKSKNDSTRTLCMKTACTYLSFVRAALNLAVRENIIKSNPFDGIRKGEMKCKEHKREYLTVQEVKALERTPCGNEWLKRAFLFSCFCGLRISDILALRWKNLVKNGDDWQMEIVQQKTEASLFLPLNRHARKWLPEQGDATDEDRIFAHFNRTLAKSLHTWISAAGITKHISFHCARHTYATLCLTAGIDIYTTSQLLGHANIRHTQRYARIINSKKEAVMSMMDDYFAH